MSGHCKGCGTYHEEDDNRLCSKCRSKAQPMSEAKGPYTATKLFLSGGKWACAWDGKILDSGKNLDSIEYAVEIANLAHHHALNAQAERVRQLEEALSKAVELLDGCVEDHNFDFGCEFDQIKLTLTPPAKGDSNG